MTTSNRVAVVVDGYSAGNFLPTAFTAAGVDVVHLQSTPELIPTMLAPNLAAYRDNIVATDFADQVTRLKELDPICVIAGQESCVNLADALSEAIGVPTNGTALSTARRDKHAMIEALRAAGVRCADQFRSADVDAIEAWARDRGEVPVVVKPISSAATDGVTICRSLDEVRGAAEAILSTKDIFGFPNTEVLVQQYLAGTEYIVDTVSSAGQRFVCGIWEYEKSLLPSGRNIYDKDVLVPSDSAVAVELVGYIDEVLAALGMLWGPAHSEVIVTPDGPALVELGARLNGNLNPGFHDVCLGCNQADLTALAYTDPERFAREFGGGVYTKRLEGVVYNVPTEMSGVVESIDEDVVAELAALDSAHLIVVKLKPGARITPTVDLLTTPIRAFLVAADKRAWLADYTAISRLKDSVYRVSPNEE